MNASSAPWSSPPSLTALHPLAPCATRCRCRVSGAQAKRFGFGFGLGVALTPTLFTCGPSFIIHPWAGVTSEVKLMRGVSGEAIRYTQAYYIRERWNCFDLTVLVLTTLPYIIPALAKVQALRILRVVRGVHIMRQMKVRRHITLTLVRSHASSSGLCTARIPRVGCVCETSRKAHPCEPSFGLPACKNRGLTNESEVSSPSNRRISAMCGWWCWAP